MQGLDTLLLHTASYESKIRRTLQPGIGTARLASELFHADPLIFPRAAIELTYICARRVRSGGVDGNGVGLAK